MQAFRRKDYSHVTRDLDLIREILLRVEQDVSMDGRSSFDFVSAEDFGFPDRDTDEVAYHADLLINAGMVDGELDSGYPLPRIRSLTWQGHEFLDNIKTDKIWSAAKDRVSDLKAVGLAAIADIAAALIKKHVGL